MNRKRVLPPASPYRSEDVAFARSVVCDDVMLAQVDPDKRGKCLSLAWAILTKDRAFRMGLDPTDPRGPARVIPFLRPAPPAKAPALAVPPSGPKDAA